ncbi:MAG: serine hydrolase domain-containing protein [Acidimicrobiales bacterium]
MEGTFVVDGDISSAGLARLHEAMAAYVEAGDLPGLITLVAGSGTPRVDVIGCNAFGDDRPMERDAIFRIASLSKPVVAAAAMTLVDEGLLGLSDTVYEWLPELIGQPVLRRLDSDLDDTVPATRAITVEDLLTFRMGFGLIMAPPGATPIQRAEAELELRTLGPPWPPTPHPPDRWMALFGELPLMAQPGASWMYNTGAQVLGVLVERVAGRPLETVLTARIFEPLGMVDTAFSVPPHKLDRLTTAYEPDPMSGNLDLLDTPETSYWAHPPVFPNAAGWLVSTVDDFWAFVQMLLAGGAYEGGRVLSEESVRLMTTDHLTPEQRQASSLFLGPGGGWGLGLRVPARGASVDGIPGGFGWDGGTGTTWRSDLDRRLTGILFTQRALTSPEPPPLAMDFWNAVYSSP